MFALLIIIYSHYWSITYNYQIHCMQNSLWKFLVVKRRNPKIRGWLIEDGNIHRVTVWVRQLFRCCTLRLLFFENDVPHNLYVLCLKWMWKINLFKKKTEFWLKPIYLVSVDEQKYFLLHYWVWITRLFFGLL